MSRLDIVVTSRSFSQNPELKAECTKVFPKVRFNEQGLTLRGNELLTFIGNADAAIVALERIDEQVLSNLPNLKVIAKYGVGLDNIDQEALKKRGIKLAWQPGVNRRSVAELVLAFALGVSRNVLYTTRQMSQGIWQTAGGFDLTGKTFAVIGCGFVGTEVLELLKPFECKVLIVDIVDKSEVCSVFGARQVDLSTALKTADFVSLHVPFDTSTKNLISRNELGLMRSSAILINAARGGVVNEIDLAEALSSNKIRAAASDVFASEPASLENNPLLKLPNFFGTPHIGGNSKEAVHAMGLAAIYGLAKVCSESNL